MPWSDEYYPVSMKNLPPRVRHKAIEIANALLAAGRPVSALPVLHPREALSINNPQELAAVERAMTEHA